MEASANGSSFGIDSLLSHRPGSPVSKGDSLVGECRSPLEFSPRSDVESGCSSPPSPRRECVDEVAQRQGHGVGLPPHLQHAQISAGSQQRTVTSSFLIRDILADCKPLAACAPYSSNGQPTQEAGRLASKIAEDFMEKIHSNSSSDSEYKGKDGEVCEGAALLWRLEVKLIWPSAFMLDFWLLIKNYLLKNVPIIISAARPFCFYVLISRVAFLHVTQLQLLCFGASFYVFKNSFKMSNNLNK